MSGILPVSENMPNEGAAVAFSEIEARSSEFYASRLATQGEDYPPTLSDLTIVSSSYIDYNEPDEPKHGFMMLPFEGCVLSDMADAYLDGYRSIVVPAHDFADNLLARGGISLFEGAAHLALEASKKAKLHTLSSFILYSSLDGSGHYPALMTPRVLHDDIAMGYREVLITMLDISQDKGIDVFENLDDKESADIKAILQNNSQDTINFAVFVASLFLPRISEVERGLEFALQGEGCSAMYDVFPIDNPFRDSDSVKPKTSGGYSRIIQNPELN